MNTRHLHHDYKLARLNWVHWAVLSFSLFLTAMAWFITKQQIQDKNYHNFLHESEEAISLIRERMVKYEDALWSGVAFLKAQKNTTNYQKWRDFSDSLHIHTRHPGINGIGIINNINPNQLDAYLAEQKIERPDFKIHPPHKNNEFWPITYIEPHISNKAAIGLDIAHEKNRLTAAKKARDTGSATITAPIQLVQDSAKTPGFLFYAPFYSIKNPGTVEEKQKHFIGMVYAPFIVKKLMLGTLEKHNRHIGIKIKDKSSVLYSEHNISEPNYDPKPLFKISKTQSLYGREWTFDLQSTKSFREYNENNTPIVILLSGILIDTLLFALFVILSNSNRNALSLAEQMTRNFQESNSALKNAVGGIAKLDKTGHYLEINESYSVITGYKPSGLINSHWKTTIYPDDIEKVEQQFSELTTIKKFQTELRGLQPDGTTYHKLWTCIANNYSDNSNVSCYIFIDDISDRKNAEMSLKNLIQQLETSNSDLQNFAYSASHDLKEPLRIITSYCDLLHRRYENQLDEEAIEYINEAREGASRMQSLISDILNFSRLTRNKPKQEICNLNEVINLIEHDLKLVLDEKNAIIEFENLPIIEADITQIKIVLQNLILNGIKFNNKEKPQIKISAEVIENDTIISVADNGLGIDEKYQDKIFDMFYRLYSRNEYEGTGIGLAAATRIIQLYNGKLWIEHSEIDKGSKFSFSIPITLNNNKQNKI